jgi:glycosyltransferase involved in cell wall biosynthesis
VKRLKVVRVYKAVKGSGGVHARLAELLPRLAEHIDVRVLCYRERGDRAQELEAAGVPVDVVPTGIKWAPWNVERFAAYFRRERPDVVHTHEYTANTLAIAAADRASVPIRIRHLHSMAPWGWGSRLRTRLRVATDARAARRSRLTLAVSQAVRRVYLEKTRLPPDSCRVLYNGFDLRRFEGCAEARAAFRQELQIPAGVPVVGIVGRLARGKGFVKFLEASHHVAAMEPRAWFLVVGDGGLRPQLEQDAAARGLADRTRFAGFRRDVPAALGAMDVFLFTGESDGNDRIQDGLPGVVIEAQAAGLPVVSFRLPMMEEVLREGAGTLVDPGDAEAMARATLAYLRNPIAKAETGAAARRDAARFTVERCTGETLELYERLLAESTTARGAPA